MINYGQNDAEEILLVNLASRYLQQQQQESSSDMATRNHAKLALLSPELMSPSVFQSRLREGLSVPSSITKGRTYVLKLGSRIKVLDEPGGKKRRSKPKVAYLCVGTGTQCKHQIDEYTSLYLNLVLNERELLRVANVMDSDRLPLR